MPSRDAGLGSRGLASLSPTPDIVDGLMSQVVTDGLTADERDTRLPSWGRSSDSRFASEKVCPRLLIKSLQLGCCME